MQLFDAFPIAIIDEDYEGKHAAGRGMQQLAAAIEKEGFRVVAGITYKDARRLVKIFNNEFLLADLRRRLGGRRDAMAGARGGLGSQTQPQRPTADLPVR